MNKRIVAPALISGLLCAVSLGPVHAADKKPSDGAQGQTPPAKTAVQPSAKAENEVKSSGATTVKDKESAKAGKGDTLESMDDAHPATDKKKPAAK